MRTQHLPNAVPSKIACEHESAIIEQDALRAHEKGRAQRDYYLRKLGSNAFY